MEERPFIHTSRHLADVLAQARRERGLTRSQLAQLAGVTAGFIADVEHARPRAEIVDVLAILTALGLRPRALPARPDWVFDAQGQLKPEYHDRS